MVKRKYKVTKSDRRKAGIALGTTGAGLTVLGAGIGGILGGPIGATVGAGLAYGGGSVAVGGIGLAAHTIYKVKKANKKRQF